ncbi:MAG: biopolymer transporter ExbD, partial [Polyangiaceae bacterium]|nr:biopolymer transporter ExbD [Polyangiaceae bacterium]
MHKRRTVAVRPQSRQNAEINVTPLVDVVLVLLIIFMVVTPLLEKEITVQVPATETVEDVSDLPPDQLVVHLDDKGEVKLNSEVVAADAFLGHLKDILEHRGDKTVFFQT